MRRETKRETKLDIEVRHRNAAAGIARRQPERAIIDVTSRGSAPWVGFSPFFPHGDIPVPFSAPRVAASVEGIWQGLKVFEGADVDEAVLAKTTMRGIKRTVRRHGPVRGHRRGLTGSELLGYGDARRLIYLPTYAWVLEHKLAEELEQLVALARRGPLTLLDYETNCDADDLRRPLSHAGLVMTALRAVS